MRYVVAGGTGAMGGVLMPLLVKRVGAEHVLALVRWLAVRGREQRTGEGGATLTCSLQNRFGNATLLPPSPAPA